MYFLDKLWQGKIQPGEYDHRKDGEYQRLSKELGHELDMLMQAASPEVCGMLERIEQLSLSLLSVHDEQIFIQGFRYGGRMMLDTIGEHNGQMLP